MQVKTQTYSAFHDLNDDGVLDLDDHRHWITELKSTWYGDANLDGMGDASDLNAVGFNWLGAAGWAGGDFTGDGLVDAADLNVLGFNWLKETEAAPLAVPEPSLTIALLVTFVVVSQRLRRD